MGIIKRAVRDRLAGNRPSPFRAVAVATVAGVMAAGITYKALRG